jgi:hypothetical protein
MSQMAYGTPGFHQRSSSKDLRVSGMSWVFWVCCVAVRVFEPPSRLSITPGEAQCKKASPAVDWRRLVYGKRSVTHCVPPPLRASYGTRKLRQMDDREVIHAEIDPIFSGRKAQLQMIDGLSVSKSHIPLQERPISSL